MIALGNALGYAHKNKQALKGRPEPYIEGALFYEFRKSFKEGLGRLLNGERLSVGRCVKFMRAIRPPLQGLILL